MSLLRALRPNRWMSPLRNMVPQTRFHMTADEISKAMEGKCVNLSFVLKDGTEKSVRAPLGWNLLDLAHHYELEVEGACGGALACSTCHLILDPKDYDRIPEPSEREEDILDLAPGLEDTSRLGCQVIVDDAMEGSKVKLPHATLNFYVDGHVPKPH